MPVDEVFTTRIFSSNTPIQSQNSQSVLPTLSSMIIPTLSPPLSLVQEPLVIFAEGFSSKDNITSQALINLLELQWTLYEPIEACFTASLICGIT